MTHDTLLSFGTTLIVMNSIFVIMFLAMGSVPFANIFLLGCGIGCVLGA